MELFQEKDVTFINSKNIPFQRWYPYVEGYSPTFVKNIINTYCNNSTLIYEPFAGTGTTLFASDSLQINTIYSEINPLLRFLIKTKISVLSLSDKERLALSQEIIKHSNNIISESQKINQSIELYESYKTVFGNSLYFSNEQFELILRIRSYIDIEYSKNNNIIADIISVATFSCLLPISYLKKQGDVRFKTEKERANNNKVIQIELPSKLKEIAEDIANLEYKLSMSHELITENAKDIGIATKNEISDVITSPPYLNGTNYFRNTKLELWFLKYLKTENDLRFYRDATLTSGINDVKKEYKNIKTTVISSLFEKTITDLEKKAYDSRIPLMAKCYFQEMQQLFSGLKLHLKDNANILIDLGDSIFSGVHIKTDYILIEILENLGFIFNDRIILRQRRSRNGENVSQVLLIFKYKQNI